jgi:hypothetical protein
VASNTAPRGHAHIAEQRVDADRLPPTDEAAKAGDPSLPTAKTKDKAKDAADAVIKSPKSVTATTEKGNPEPAQTDNAQTDNAQTDNAQTDNAQTDNAQIGNAQIENAQTEKVRAEKVRAEGAQTKKAHADNAQAEKAPAEKAAAGGAKAGKPSPGKAQPKESSAKAQPRTMAEDTPNVPGARLSSYAEEAAELLAGLSANRRRRKPGTDESTADPAHDGAIG